MAHHPIQPMTRGNMRELEVRQLDAALRGPHHLAGGAARLTGRPASPQSPIGQATPD